MNEKSRRSVLRTLGGVAVVGSLAGCSSNQDGEGSGGSAGGESTATSTPTTTETEMDTDTETATEEPATAMLRVAHLSPDAPTVDVSVDGSVVLEGVSFGAVSDYLSLRSGTYTR